MNLFVNLGRSVQGIAADAIATFGKPANLFVLALEGDRLLGEVTLPEGATVVTVGPDGSFTSPVAAAKDDVCVLNGGTTPQQWAMARLSGLGMKCRVVNLQRDGTVEMRVGQVLPPG
jgi:hypothetical protein